MREEGLLQTYYLLPNGGLIIEGVIRGGGGGCLIDLLRYIMTFVCPRAHCTCITQQLTTEANYIFTPECQVKIRVLCMFPLTVKLAFKSQLKLICRNENGI